MNVSEWLGPCAVSLRWAAIGLACVTVTACGTTQKPVKRAHGKEYFSEKEYGVKASPRVATGNNIPKGGGRYIVGDPYQVKGKWYYPREDFSYSKTGIASWYGSAFHGRLTANGEVYDQMHLSAAHPTFPLPSYARVTNLENGSSIIVRVNDRGPYHEGRIIDLSNKTADMLDLQHSGTGMVRVQYVGKARMDGHDMPYLMASYVPKGSRLPGINPGGQIATGVMVASNSKQITGDELQSLNGPVPVPRSAALAAPSRAPAASATSYAGSTPSAGNGAVPNLRPPTPASLPFALVEPGATAGLPLLPQIGPVPRERPSSAYAARSLALGYQGDGVRTVSTPIAFDAVMVRNDGLTEQSILASFKRRQAASSDR